MQPFDALSLQAVLEEAKPLIVGRKVEKVYQPHADEVVLGFRGRGSTLHFLLSAHAGLGHACLTEKPRQQKEKQKQEKISNFCQFLRKYLGGALLYQLEAVKGERIVDLVFACPDEIGQTKLRILTAEIMGRHSNLIFWDKASAQILAVSHLVTNQMSRVRELAPNLSYVRPPAQNKPNIFSCSEEEFKSIFAQAPGENKAGIELESFLVRAFSGISRHLAEDLTKPIDAKADLGTALWMQLSKLRMTPLATKPAMHADLTAYSLFGQSEENKDDLIFFPTVNKLLDEYYQHLNKREEFNRLSDRISAKLKAEKKKLESKLNMAQSQIDSTLNLDELKKYGDIILAHIQEISPGQSELNCLDYESPEEKNISISLNPNLSPQANAQIYYKQFTKAKTRRKTQEEASESCQMRLFKIESLLGQLCAATTIEELEPLEPSLGEEQKAKMPRQKSKTKKSTLLNFVTPDGWTVYVGRNRKENDFLIAKVAQAQDIWLHVAGTTGGHVVIKVPSTGMMPPQVTFKMAAELAARHSSAKSAGKVRVIYTQCKYLRKSPGDKAGVVRYENEKSFDVEL